MAIPGLHTTHSRKQVWVIQHGWTPTQEKKKNLSAHDKRNKDVKTGGMQNTHAHMRKCLLTILTHKIVANEM